jgi:hypothetical protein
MTSPSDSSLLSDASIGPQAQWTPMVAPKPLENQVEREDERDEMYYWDDLFLLVSLLLSELVIF